ncbi:hypothetical protein [Paenibacillus sp. J2TS4]|uniref:hypothetical protein n=1 Tax=Paenibacillus sp. J2TS4 TaxID=2807194 RepID=UPI001AFD9017|nr:hypothetical protein [Paenibacillus sp. J2TS4]GIP35236.1 hypothetical protein J2TS4_44460 [Paenibacillus sp. J2TS4]
MIVRLMNAEDRLRLLQKLAPIKEEHIIMYMDLTVFSSSVQFCGLYEGKDCLGCVGWLSGKPFRAPAFYLIEGIDYTPLFAFVRKQWNLSPNDICVTILSSSQAPLYEIYFCVSPS